MIAVFLMALLVLGPTDGRPKGRCRCNWLACNQPVCASNHETFECMCQLNCRNYYSEHQYSLHKLYDGECYADT